MSGVKAVLPMAVIGRGKLAGRSWPANLLRVGFGSNKSRWLGPPSMKHQITDFALASNWGGLAASGLVKDGRLDIAVVAEFAPRFKRAHNANDPNPPPARQRKSRRDWAHS